MDIIDRAYDRACCELEDILQKQKFEGRDVEYFGEFIDILKDIDKMGTMNYSQTNNDSRYNNDNGYSGRMPMYGYMRGRSNNSGYSRDESKTMMLDHLQKVADMAIDEKDRKAVERLMSQMSEN